MLLDNYERSQAVFTLHPGESSRRASRVVWMLGEKKRPFETIKGCVLTAVEEVVSNDQARNQIITSIKSMP